MRDDEGPGYRLSPQLGLVLAARCRPGFVITVEVAGVPLHCPALFGLADDTEAIRGIVLESPAGASKGKKIRWLSLPPALDMTYMYELLTLEQAAHFLARYTIGPVPDRHGIKPGTPRLVTRFHPSDSSGSLGHRVVVYGDEAVARVDPGDGRPTAEYDLDDLRDFMWHLIEGRLGER